MFSLQSGPPFVRGKKVYVTTWDSILKQKRAYDLLAVGAADLLGRWPFGGVIGPGNRRHTGYSDKYTLSSIPQSI